MTDFVSARHGTLKAGASGKNAEIGGPGFPRVITYPLEPPGVDATTRLAQKPKFQRPTDYTNQKLNMVFSGEYLPPPELVLSLRGFLERHCRKAHRVVARATWT